MKPPIRLLAIDIDGTLLDPNFQISGANLAALKRAREAGIEVMLVTGRRHRFALPIVETLGFPLWLISSNGAITRSSQGELFHRDLLPARTARKICAHMTEFRGNLILTFDKETKGALVVERVDDMTAGIRRWLEKNTEFIEYVAPIERSLDSDPVQAMFCGTVEHMKHAEERLVSGHLAGEVTVLKTRYDARDLCIIDVLNQGCSKGHALERWAKHRGLRREEIMAIGDNYNDVEMLEFAGVPVIMGNASEDLKHKAWRVTLPNDQSGVAAAVEQVLGI